LGQLLDGPLVSEAAREKEDLQVEGPPAHVLIKILQVGVVFNLLEYGMPSEVFAHYLCERTLARADVARDGDVFLTG
jgi:hypothetical protein